MDLRIKRMQIAKNLSSLRSWIISDLKSDEILTFFLDKDCEDECKITVKKTKHKFNVMLSDKVLGEFFEDELNYVFTELCEVDYLKDILIYNSSITDNSQKK